MRNQRLTIWPRLGSGRVTQRWSIRQEAITASRRWCEKASSAGDTHYEGQLWDENTPASSAFGLPVLLNNDSTFSSWFGLPLLAKSQSPKVRISTSQKAKSTFGFPLLTKSQNARSTFGIPLLIKSK